MPKRFEQWDIWLANVRFADVEGSKVRPVMILDPQKGLVLALYMTTKTKKKNMYEIKDWKRAGLKEPTAVRIVELLEIQDTDMHRRIGRATLLDILNIQKKLKRF
jgi:hypothetical protein